MPDNFIPHVVDTLPVHITLQLNPPHNTIENNIIYLDEGFTFPIMGNITLESFLETVKEKYQRKLFYSVQADSKTVGVLVLATDESNLVEVFIYIHPDFRHFGITDVLIHSLILSAKQQKVNLVFKIEESNKSALDSFKRIIKNLDPVYSHAGKTYTWVVKPEYDILCSSSNRWLAEELSWSLTNIYQQ